MNIELERNSNEIPTSSMMATVKPVGNNDGNDFADEENQNEIVKE